jgi:hypothetical protein
MAQVPRDGAADDRLAPSPSLDSGGKALARLATNTSSIGGSLNSGEIGTK